MGRTGIETNAVTHALGIDVDPGSSARPEAAFGAGRADAWDRLPARTLVVTPAAPPNDSGQAVVLDRLLRPVHPDDYRLLVFAIHNSLPVRDAAPLPARTAVIRATWSQAPSATALLDQVRIARHAASEVVRRARIIANVAIAEGCRVILGTTGLLPSLPAAILAGKMSGLPVVVQMFDHWQMQTPERISRTIGRLLEPTIVRSAASVVVPNELLADIVHRQTGVQPVVIRNPIDDAALADRAPAPWPLSPNELRVVYTGQVYEAQADALARLVEALSEPGLGRARLHVYAHQSREEVASFGVSGPIIVHPFVPAPDVYQVHREADVLVLPLAFGGIYREIIRSSSTTKLADYLASGRPTLIHAPKGAFPAWYAATNTCALVVDTPSSAALAAGLRLLMRDGDLRQRLGEAGLRQARAEFDAGVARRQLADVLATAVR